MWFIGVEVEQETSAPPPKKNPGSAPALDSLYVSIDGVDIPLFFNVLDVFAECIISVVELVIVIRINASLF